MHELCHRCGGDLPMVEGRAPFCPHCGAPQLYLTEAYLDEQASRLVAGDDTTGTLPPPMPRQVDWQTAIRCAALVGGIAALLSIVALRVPGVSVVNTLWVLSASATTLLLYQRRRPLAWMDAGIGARLGLTTGISLIVLMAAAMSIAGVIGRFGLHDMASFDAEIAQLFLQVKQNALGVSSTPPPQEVLKLYDVPEFQAGLLLTSMGMSAIILILFCVFGGALGGMLRTRRRIVR